MVKRYVVAYTRIKINFGVPQKVLLHLRFIDFQLGVLVNFTWRLFTWSENLSFKNNTWILKLGGSFDNTLCTNPKEINTI